VLSIRHEELEDVAAVRFVNEQAFGREAEANLVEALRAAAKVAISLVAIQDDAVVGHILFSPVAIEPAGGAARPLGLAPVAVLPACQRGGIGTLLIEAGLAECRKGGFDGVMVLGHPEYYPRFGFIPAGRFGLNCEYDAPEEAFMALELRPARTFLVPMLPRRNPFLDGPPSCARDAGASP
jgi:putative acetyltransferase